MPVIDADAHVIETERTWDYLKGDERRFRPEGIRLEQGDGRTNEFWLIDGRRLRRRSNVGRETTEESREMLDINGRLAHMDQLGVDVQVLFPTLFLTAVTQKPEVELALTRSYNRWMADIWSEGKGRLVWAAVLPMLSVDRAVEELRWARRNGACAVFMHGIETAGLPYDPRFFPIYEEASRLDVPLAFHSGNSHFDNVALCGEETFRRSKLPVIATFHALVDQGIPDRFPDLRIGFVEVAALWLPYALRDLENRFRRTGRTLKDDVLRTDRLYVACQSDDDIPYVVRYAGEDNLLMGSDYGHNDNASELECLSRLRRHPELGAVAAEKILCANPARFYGLS
jgi:predicted TIM-barrel fold metal-dependent hydrolase